MQKLLVAFVSVVTLLGLVAPSSAYAVEDPTRRDDARHPQPSHHFKHKHDGHHEDRDIVGVARDLSQLPPTRRGFAEHPEPSHRFKHKHHDHGDDNGKGDDEHDHEQDHKPRNSDRLARGLPPLPPARRDSAKHPRPSHNHKHHGHGDDNGKGDDEHDHEQDFEPRNGINHARGLPPTVRDDARHPEPSHRFKHKHHDHGDDNGKGDDEHDHEQDHKPRNSDRLARGLPPLPPARRDSAEHPRPSHHFNHKHHDHGDDNGKGDDEHDHEQDHKSRNSDRLARGLPPLPPARRDSAKHPRPSNHFEHKHHGHGDNDGDGDDDA